MFFFCKQKTAYEMRISDWSSDVCSSDLLTDDITFTTVLGYQRGKRSVNGTTGGPFRAFDYDFSDRVTQKSIEARLARSEEHTSELQSLMRISYAVFCLKKKNNKKQTTTYATSIQHRTTLYFRKIPNNINHTR